MPRWNWLKHRSRRLESGTLDELTQDIEYCRHREEIATLKSHVKTWRQRRAEAESSVVERFGEEALSNRFGSSRA
jgi:hypothetical protein